MTFVDAMTEWLLKSHDPYHLFHLPHFKQVIFNLLHAACQFSLIQLMCPTVKKMVEMGKAVLHDQGITNMMDIR